MSRYANLPDYLRAAFEQDDKQRAENEVTDRRIEELQSQCKRSRGEIVRKVYDPAATQQHTATMDPTTQSRWDQWADAKIDRALLQFLKGQQFKETLGALISELRREWQGEIKKSLVDVKLPSIKPYISGRAYGENDVVVHGGSCFQAKCDTSRPPGNQDWSCIVSCGDRGVDGRSADMAIQQIASLCVEVERLQQQLAELKTDAEVQRVAKVLDLPDFRKRGHG